MTKKKSVLILLSERGGGDIPPVVALACGMRDRGDRVSVLCDSETAKLVSSTGLSTITLPKELDRRGHVTRWIRQLKHSSNELRESSQNPLVEWANPIVPFADEAVLEFKPDLIVSTLFCMGLADALATYSGVPWCFVNPSFYFGDHSVRKWEEDWYGPFIPRLARDCFLPLVMRADIVLHATDPQFDLQPAELPANHHYVGFLLWEPARKSPKYLDESGDRWALVTLSTVRQEDEISLARSALWALDGRPVRTLLTLPGEDIRRELGEIPSNATLAGFVPHSLVLRQSSIVINHAGHGIVSKALYHGVPMVLLPWDRDQPGVAARAGRLGVARIVPRSETDPHAVRRAAAVVFDEPQYREAAVLHSERLKAFDSVELACSLLEDI